MLLKILWCILISIKIDHIKNNMDKQILFHILIYLNLISLLIGFLLGRFYISSVGNPIYNNINNTKKNSNKNSIPINNIEIDDKKIVLDINTSGLEKKYQSLGQVTQKDNDISESINKLKNIKKS